MLSFKYFNNHETAIPFPFPLTAETSRNVETYLIKLPGRERKEKLRKTKWSNATRPTPMQDKTFCLPAHPQVSIWTSFLFFLSFFFFFLFLNIFYVHFGISLSKLIIITIIRIILWWYNLDFIHMFLYMMIGIYFEKNEP